ncbi:MULTISPECIES: DegT/DnrJ/EryC1/StrS family aminotransferase [unclassified Paenibacillus]|uniref:DegT/DnrJ/EryC1/StrS family aminotransferase n=1 Tax=unclassified Paenibacillus TaxID=185978 RepID=UPI003636AD74
MSSFLPFALPDIGEEEIAEVVDSLRSGWLTTGPKTKRFEQDFVDFLGGNVEAISVNSATSGLHLALEAIGVGPGDEVITTPYTFTATAEVIRYLGADPIFVDIDSTTFNIDPSKLEAVITPRTKAIIPVHFAGLSCDMDPIITIARKHGLKVVEDAAHAMPTTYKGDLIGTLKTDVTVYSFYATKTIATGEGGMIITRDSKIAERCKVMRLHGISRDAFDRYTSTKPSWQYEIVAPGYKYNMTDLAASLGIHQLKKVRMFQQKRKKMAELYDQELAKLPIVLPPKALRNDIHAWHLYVIRLAETTISRDSFIERMASCGIGCSVHFIPLHLHPYWRDTYSLSPSDFPNALSSYEKTVSLPIYTKMNEEDQYRVIDSVRAILS